MKRISLFLIILLLTTCSLSPAKETPKKRGKTVVTGKTKWFTEQNSFEEILKIAQKENKPVLALFTAKWCGPCVRIKKDVFSKDEFQEVGKEAVLYYVEQTIKTARDFIKAQKIGVFPTFKLY